MEMSVVELARSVLETEAESLLSLRGRIGDDFIKAVDLIDACKGRTILTGIGKTGIIAQKISATLASIGIPSLYLHAADAYHGDIGRIVKNDVVVAVSNSGESEELTRLLPIIKRMGAMLISLTGGLASTLAHHSDIVIDCGVEKEACSIGLVPTSSTTAALAMGDAIAVAIIEKRGFKAKDFACYHPGGSLGRRLLLRVEDIMRKGRECPITDEQTDLQSVLVMITEARAGAAIIVDGTGRLSGIFTDGDLRRLMESSSNKSIFTAPVRDVMTHKPVTVRQGTLVHEAMRIIQEKFIDEIPVVDEVDRPVGIIDEKNLIGLW